jgi:hypothetical protein
MLPFTDGRRKVQSVIYTFRELRRYYAPAVEFPVTPSVSRYQKGQAGACLQWLRYVPSGRASAAQKNPARWQV